MIDMNLQLQLSDEVQKIMTYSREEAMRLGNYTIGPEHLLLGILRHGDNEATALLT